MGGKQIRGRLLLKTSNPSTPRTKTSQETQTIAIIDVQGGKIILILNSHSIKTYSDIVENPWKF